jgi:hypothetical protein
LVSWLGRRRIVGLIGGTVCGLFWAIWSHGSAFDTVAFVFFCAYSGVVLAEKATDRLSVRNIILAALAGSVLIVFFELLIGKTAGIIRLRSATGGAILGAIIGSEPRKATRGAKIGGGIGAGLGLVESSSARSTHRDSSPRGMLSSSASIRCPEPDGWPSHHKTSGHHTNLVWHNCCL